MHSTLFHNLENFQKIKTFETPRELIEAAVIYFRWVDDHPLLEEQLFSHQGATFTGNKKKMRPYTLQGFTSHAGTTLNRFRGLQKKTEFQDAIEMIEQVIYTQKFEGASSGFFNAGIISRDLGLADKSEISGPGGSAVPVTFEITPIAHGSYLTDQEQKEGAGQPSADEQPES